ncbi:MAG TPA: hypothetical protein VHY22_11610 [Chthoniobacteraceae bacterium]|jgi:sugar lactone lactonase YvrE|nr:hypothetical protein [Chthoniobacteraceae bacterium]
MKTAYRTFFAAGLAALLSTSAGYARSRQPAAPVFYPPAPDDPHIQYLTSFSSEEGLQGQRKFYTFIVGTEKVQRPILKPYGIAESPGKWYIADTIASAIEIADLNKKRLRYFQPNSEGSIRLPINIAVDGDGTRYVTDTGRNQVLVYKGDTYIGAIGKTGEINPVGIGLSKSRIYVSDVKGHCVRVYDKGSRNQLFTFPKSGTGLNAQLYSPTNLTVDTQGNVYVCDTGAFRVTMYDADGKYIRTFGRQGLEPGTFARPKGVAVDREGRLYVADAATQVVQLFDPQGHLLMYFGNPLSGTGDSTCMPAGIAVDYDNLGQFQKFVAPNFSVEYLVMVVNQFGGHKIDVFGFGHKK